MPNHIFSSIKIIVHCLLAFICLLLPHQGLAHQPNSFDMEDLLEANRIFLSDLDAMVERGVIRVLMPYNRAFVYFEGAESKEISYENARLFYQFINKKLGTTTLKIHMPSIPTPRDKLFQWLVEGKGDIEELELNIHAGVKYLRFLSDTYFTANQGFDPLNRAFFTFAAYNAGPAKVASLRKETARMGLNPNIWIRNAEIVAAKRIGSETVQYVINILKYYSPINCSKFGSRHRRGPRQQVDH